MKMSKLEITRKARHAKDLSDYWMNEGSERMYKIWCDEYLFLISQL
jgi:coproporphyrinogen III oxidase